MDIRRNIEGDRRDTDEKLREEREHTDRVIAREPVQRADEVLEQTRAEAEERLRQLRDDVDAALTSSSTVGTVESVAAPAELGKLAEIAGGVAEVAAELDAERQAADE